MSFRRGQTSSRPWARLKPVEQDPLESIGLPSKGDTRLLDSKTQEKYYTRIVERYIAFCSDAGQRDELLRRFSSLNINDPSAIQEPLSAGLSHPNQVAIVLQNPKNLSTLSTLMAALRKLREGIVASSRADDFAIQAYLFCIRLAILVKQPETYHPALLHLIRAIHPEHALTTVELHEVVAYLVLDTSCRRKELAEAFALRQRYGLTDSKVNTILAALSHDNYVMFHRVRRTVDAHRARLMEFAEPELRLHTLKCFSRSYLGVDLHFLEQCTNTLWDDLKCTDGVGWELDGSNVIIRRVRSK